MTFKTGTKYFHLQDVYRYQEYPGTDNRWKERAFLFRDGSILWETMGFSTYAADGSRFSTDGLIHQNGAKHLPGRINGGYPHGIDRLVEDIKKHGTHLFELYSAAWEMPVKE